MMQPNEVWYHAQFAIPTLNRCPAAAMGGMGAGKNRESRLRRVENLVLNARENRVLTASA